IPRPMVYAALGALAAMVVLMLSALSDSDPAHAPPTPAVEPSAFVAQLTEAIDCRWENPQLPTQVGGAFTRGKVKLVQGFARLSFASGADVLLEAPCTFEFDGGNRGFLHAGRLTASVPRRARGFTIAAHGVEVIDLGTAFGMS